MRTQLALSAFVLAPLVAAGCASGDGQGAPGASSGSAPASIVPDPIALDSAKYFTLRRALLPVACPPAGCDMWWVHEVNHPDEHEVFVGKLDFSESGLEPSDVALVRDAPTDELLVEGQLAPMGTDGRELRVFAAHRGMPDLARDDAASFFLVADSSRGEPEIARLLNHGEQEPFTTFSLAQVDHRVQTDWLVHRLRDGGAVARGAIAQAADGAHELDASQVYLRLPERIGPCPELPLPICPQGTVATFTRTVDRCLAFAGCVQPVICPFLLPMCAPAYDKIAWRAPPSACEASVCDPAWASTVR